MVGSRRTGRIGVVGMVFLLMVAACGGDDADTATEPPATTQAVTAGDPERGRQIWDDGGGVVGVSAGVGCQACHSLDGSEKTVGFQIAPTWQGISLRAGDRVPGLSAEEYLRESIVDPAAYIVEGYSDHMPKGFRFLLSEEDIDSLIAFILTQ